MSVLCLKLVFTNPKWPKKSGTAGENTEIYFSQTVLHVVLSACVQLRLLYVGVLFLK